MTREFHVRFANGVLIPSEKVELPLDRELTVRIVDADIATIAGDGPRYDDPDDPRPEGGVALADWWTRHRLQVSPEAAKIATDPEFNIENS
jgi:hypothetical protein